MLQINLFLNYLANCTEITRTPNMQRQQIQTRLLRNIKEDEDTLDFRRYFTVMTTRNKQREKERKRDRAGRIEEPRWISRRRKEHPRCPEERMLGNIRDATKNKSGRGEQRLQRTFPSVLGKNMHWSFLRVHGPRISD